MISGLKPKELLFRDGTNQFHRENNALNPASVSVDEQSISDLVGFAQNYAKQLHFFDSENNPSGNWEGFLIDDYANYKQASEEDRKELRAKWITELVAYIESPEKYANDPVMLDRFARPHVSLFVTFLKLLGVIQEQLNGLTKRHLDYCYREILGLNERKPIPDVVHVIIELASDVGEYLIEKDTLLSAGRDSRGEELVYKLNADTVISHAQIEQVRNVFTDKLTIEFKDIREEFKKEADGGLKQILQLALGHPNPGNELPYYKNNKVVFSELKKELEDEEVQAYIQTMLYLDLEDYNSLESIDGNSTEEEWEIVYSVLEQAYKKKVIASREQILQQIHEFDAETGFFNMWKYALGFPDAYDDLPVYNFRPVTVEVLLTIYQQLTDPDRSQYFEASAYLKSSLYMVDLDFQKCIEIYKISLKKSNKPDWSSVYQILQKAQSKKQHFELGPPKISSYRNIYAVNDARATAFSLIGEDVEGSLRFKTFGKRVPVDNPKQVQPALIGLGLASPILKMEEGVRTLTLNFLFENPSTIELIDNLQELVEPFQFSLSSNDSWVHLIPKSIVFSEQQITKDEPMAYVGLEVIAELLENDKPIVKPNAINEIGNIHSQHPLLLILLNNQNVQKNQTIPYDLLKELKVKKVDLSVKVEGLKKLNLQNDTSILSYKKPFEPFGTLPEAGGSFYLTHPELCSKRLDSFSFNLQWMNPPVDFSSYYANYIKIAVLDKTPEEIATIQLQDFKNESFKATLSIKDHAIETVLDEVSLFNVADATTETTFKTQSSEIINLSPLEFDDSIDDLVDSQRYFRLELNNPDFQQTAYPLLLTRQAYIEADSPEKELKKLILNPPYIPKLKSITAGYTTSLTIDLKKPTNLEEEHELFHVHPYGYTVIDETLFSKGFVPLFPDYTNEGELYLGISGLQPPQSLPILFQMAEGSASPDFPRPTISWDYLSNNRWKPFPQGSFPSDSTNGLIDTGILVINVPEDITANNELLGGSLFWIRAKVQENSMAIADTVNILSQSALAVFVDNNNASDHLLTLLKPDSIKAPVITIPQIKKIAQPYTSSKGKPAESDAIFNTRVSERLRHKNRAITMWDYERLVLDRFPEIHKVKCVPAEFSANSESYGNVDVIVIPDIRGKLPFNPFQPKLPSETLNQVQQFLNQRKSAFATVRVKNPSFLHIKTRFAVKFKDDSNDGYFKRLLDEALKKNLAPWAYDETIDVVLGGKIFANMIVNFIAEQPYVDFVAGIRLFQSENGIDFRESRTYNNGENVVQVTRPDVILVSAQSHDIDIVSGEGYNPDEFSGIDFMKIEFDFIVSKDQGNAE